VAVVSAAVGYIAERIAPVDKTAEPAAPPEPPTLEERVEKIEKAVGGEQPAAAVAAPISPDPPSGAAPVPLTGPEYNPNPMYGGARTPVKIRIVG